MAQNVARLGVVFGMDSAEFEAGLKKASRLLDDMVTKAKYASAGLAVAFTAMTAKALQYGDQISDVAKANEVAVKTVMALSEGLAQNGGSAENAGKLLSSFTAKIDDAAQGSKEAQATFARLGITLKDLAVKDMTGLFDQAIMSLGRMDDTITRNALAMTIFGKASKQVDFKGLAEGSQEARDKFAEYADAVEKAGELHDKLDAKATKTMVMFTKAFIPTLNVLMDEFNKTGGAMETFFDFTGTGFKKLVVGINYLITYLKLLPDYLKAVLDIGFKPSDKWKVLEDIVNTELDKVKEFAEKIFAVEVKTTKKIEPTGREVIPYTDTEAVNKEKRTLQNIELAKQLTTEFDRQSKYQYEQLVLQGRTNILSEKERQIQEAVARVTDETSKKLTEIQNKKEQAGIMGEDPRVIKELERQKEEVMRLGKSWEDLTKKQITSQIESQNTFSYGWNKAFNQYYEDAENYSQLGARAFDTLTNSMSSAIDNFVDSGKASFSDFTKSIIKDLIKIQLKMSAMQLFKSGMGMLPVGSIGFGGGGSGVSDMFASGGGLNFGAVASGGAMASGGPVEGNTSYLVGENGPELFMPSRSGSIIPNNKLSDMGGGQTVNYNGPYIANMSAIDTQSATQFLAKNKQTIYAVNQSASRSIPTSR